MRKGPIMIVNDILKHFKKHPIISSRRQGGYLPPQGIINRNLDGMTPEELLELTYNLTYQLYGKITLDQEKRIREKLMRIREILKQDDQARYKEILLQKQIFNQGLKAIKDRKREENSELIEEIKDLQKRRKINTIANAVRNVIEKNPSTRTPSFQQMFPDVFVPAILARKGRAYKVPSTSKKKKVNKVKDTMMDVDQRMRDMGIPIVDGQIPIPSTSKKKKDKIDEMQDYLRQTNQKMLDDEQKLRDMGIPLVDGQIQMPSSSKDEELDEDDEVPMTEYSIRPPKGVDLELDRWYELDPEITDWLIRKHHLMPSDAWKDDDIKRWLVKQYIILKKDPLIFPRGVREKVISDSRITDDQIQMEHQKNFEDTSYMSRRSELFNDIGTPLSSEKKVKKTKVKKTKDVEMEEIPSSSKKKVKKTKKAKKKQVDVIDDDELDELDEWDNLDTDTKVWLSDVHGINNPDEEDNDDLRRWLIRQYRKATSSKSTEAPKSREVPKSHMGLEEMDDEEDEEAAVRELEKEEQMKWNTILDELRRKGFTEIEIGYIRKFDNLDNFDKKELKSLFNIKSSIKNLTPKQKIKLFKEYIRLEEDSERYEEEFRQYQEKRRKQREEWSKQSQEERERFPSSAPQAEYSRLSQLEVPADPNNPEDVRKANIRNRILKKILERKLKEESTFEPLDDYNMGQGISKKRKSRKSRTKSKTRSNPKFMQFIEELKIYRSEHPDVPYRKAQQIVKQMLKETN